MYINTHSLVKNVSCLIILPWAKQILYELSHYETSSHIRSIEKDDIIKPMTLLLIGKMNYHGHIIRF